MKKFSRILAVMLAAMMCAMLIPFASLAYGKDDHQLIITHINKAPTLEGAAIILSGSTYSTLGASGGTFAWWKVMTFDWDEKEGCFKVVNVDTNSFNVDKSKTPIPEKGFSYGICRGNDYSATGGINYLSDKIINTYEFITKQNIPVGTKAYLYDTDLKNAVVKNNGKLWYDKDFSSDSYIKLFEPDKGKEAYDPDKGVLLGFDIVPTRINDINYASGESILYTSKAGKYVPKSQGQYEWWKSAVFEWDEKEDCYVVSSVSKTVNNNASKQPIVPENGFALMDCGKNASIDNLKEGIKCWLYDIDPEKGTMGKNAKIRCNIPEEGKTPFKPSLNKTRLDAPKINGLEKDGTLSTLDSGTKITWDKVKGADSYTVAINESNVSPDGPMTVLPEKVNTNSFDIPDSALKTGSVYTLWVYASANGKTSGRCTKVLLKCVSEASMNTCLKDKKIVAFGDSLTAKPGYVKMLHAFLGTEVINAGVSGDNTNHGMARFEDQVLSLDPDIVIICFGMNDQATVLKTGEPNVSLENYKENLDYFAKTLISKGSDVIFMTPNPAYNKNGYYHPGAYGLDYSGKYMLPFCNAMRQVAEKYGCTLIDINYQCDFEDLDTFMSKGDGIHQSVEGHTRYAELISDHLFAVYDGLDKAEMTLTAKDTEGRAIKTYRFVGKKGAHIKIAVPEIDGYNAKSSEIATVFENGKNFEFVYSQKDYKYKVDEENLLVLNVAEKTDARTFKTKFGRDAKVTDKDGKAIDDTTKVFTGCKAVCGDKTYTVIVKGDVNGDGLANSVDYLMLKRYVLGTYELDENCVKAGIMADGTKPTAKDYTMMKRYVLETYNIYA